MPELQRIVKRDKTAGGKWLELENIEYIDHNGNHRTWECAGRVNSRGAVMMIAQLKPSNQLVLIRQFRPPAGCFVIEFPAGLIDDGESPVETAVRELYEETGLTGEVSQVISPALNSPGLSGESITAVLMTIDENDPANISPSPDLEDSEDIETFLVSPDDLSDFITQSELGGCIIDAKVMAFITGMSLGTGSKQQQ